MGGSAAYRRTNINNSKGATMAHTAQTRQQLPMHTLTARWATFLLILFLLSIMVPHLFGVSIYPSRAMYYIKEGWFMVLCIYFTLQLDETQKRLSTDTGGFIQDNGLALIATFVGLAVFLLLVVLPGFRLSYEELHVTLQTTVVSSIDLAYGVIISQRIAASAKERAEE